MITSKYCSRILATLLASCLITNPSLAGGLSFSDRQSIVGPMVCSTFRDQALSGIAHEFLRSALNRHDTVRTFNDTAHLITAKEKAPMAPFFPRAIRLVAAGVMFALFNWAEGFDGSYMLRNDFIDDGGWKVFAWVLGAGIAAGLLFRRRYRSPGRPSADRIASEPAEGANVVERALENKIKRAIHEGRARYVFHSAKEHDYPEIPLDADLDEGPIDAARNQLPEKTWDALDAVDIVVIPGTFLFFESNYSYALALWRVHTSTLLISQELWNRVLQEPQAMPDLLQIGVEQRASGINLNTVPPSSPLYPIIETLVPVAKDSPLSQQPRPYRELLREPAFVEMITHLERVAHDESIPLDLELINTLTNPPELERYVLEFPGNRFDAPSLHMVIEDVSMLLTLALPKALLAHRAYPWRNYIPESQKPPVTARLLLQATLAILKNESTNNVFYAAAIKSANEPTQHYTSQDPFGNPGTAINLMNYKMQSSHSQNKFIDPSKLPEILELLIAGRLFFEVSESDYFSIMAYANEVRQRDPLNVPPFIWSVREPNSADRYILGRTERQGPIQIRQPENLGLTELKVERLLDGQPIDGSAEDKRLLDISRKAFQAIIAGQQIDEAQLKEKLGNFISIEWRDIHDRSGEAHRNVDGSSTIVLHQILLKTGYEDALLGVLIDELDHLIHGESDIETSGRSLLNWISAIGIERVIAAVVRLGAVDLLAVLAHMLMIFSRHFNFKSQLLNLEQAAQARNLRMLINEHRQPLIQYLMAEFVKAKAALRATEQDDRMFSFLPSPPRPLHKRALLFALAA
jgi:hypothetical protein